MTDKDLELLEQYETRIRRGFPIGEVKAELLRKGFTEEQSTIFITELSRLSAKKSDDRNINFRMVVSTILILFGIIQLSTTNSKIGLWFIISGVVKIVYDQYFSKKREL